MSVTACCLFVSRNLCRYLYCCFEFPSSVWDKKLIVFGPCCHSELFGPGEDVICLLTLRIFSMDFVYGNCYGEIVYFLVVV